ncbi:MAG: hypothetical protein U0931_39790 [Vulcanimicrobiota bacterium]
MDSEQPIPKGVAVYDRPSRFKPTLLVPLLLAGAAAVAAGLHYFHYI